MLCSVCKKTMAVIFINKLDKDGKSTGETTGLCLNCAKKQGIDPVSSIMKEMSNMSEEDLENISSQFDTLFGDISELDDLENNEDSNDDKASVSSILSNMMNFGKNKKEENNDAKKDSKKKK